MAKKRISDWDGIPVKSTRRVSKSRELVANTNGRSAKPGKDLKVAREQIALLQQLTNNTVTSRVAFAQWMLDQLHDINKECGYPDSITAHEYKQMYEREGIASRVVSIYPTETWATEPEIYEDEDPGVQTQFEAAWDELNTRLGMLEKMSRLDELCGIGHYGVLFVGVNDGLTYENPIAGVEERLKEMYLRTQTRKSKSVTEKNDATESTTKEGELTIKPNTPARNVFGDIRPHYPGEYESSQQDKSVSQNGKSTKPTKQPKLDVLFVIPLDETQATISELENDPKSWRFGKPKYYNLTFFDSTDYSGMFAVPTGSMTRVHWTRVVHVADNCKSNEIFGQPRQKKVYNYLLNVRKILGGSAEMLWKCGFPGYAFEVPPEINDQVELDREGLAREVDLYMNTLKKYMSLQGVQAKVLQGQVSDPTQAIDVQILAICISIEVPKRVFMGTEEAKLASIEDATAWLNRVKGRQQKQVTPRLIRPIVDLFIAIGALPSADYSVGWGDLHTMSDADKATVAAQLTQAIVQYIAGGGDSLIPPLEFLTLILQMDRETAIAVLQAAERRLDELDGVQQEQQSAQEEKEQQQFEQELELQQTMTDGLVEGAKAGGVNIPRDVLANPANQPQFGGRNNLPIPTKNSQPIENIYCKTGKGGGKDPTCTKDDAGGSTTKLTKLHAKLRMQMDTVAFSSGTIPAMRTYSTDQRDTERVLAVLPESETNKILQEVTRKSKQVAAEAMKNFEGSEEARREREREIHWAVRDSLLLERVREAYQEDPARFGDIFKDEAERDTWYNKPQPPSYDGSPTSKSILQTETPSGRIFTVTAYEREKLHGTTNAYTTAAVAFEDETGSYDATGRGEAHTVFRKVVPAIAAYVEHKSPHVIEFNAHGESRINLYDRLVKTVAAINPDYVAAYRDVNEDDRYYYVVQRDRKDLLSRATTHETQPLVNTEDVVFLDDELDPAWFTEEGWVGLTWNIFCKTGQGGGVDPTCTKDAPDIGDGGGGTPVEKSAPKLKRIQQRISSDADKFAFSDAETIDSTEDDSDISDLSLEDIRDRVVEEGVQGELEAKIESRVEEWRNEQIDNFDPEEVYAIEIQDYVDSLGEDATEEERDEAREKVIQEMRVDAANQLSGSSEEDDVRSGIEREVYEAWAEENSELLTSDSDSILSDSRVNDTWYVQEGGGHIAKVETSGGRTFVLTASDSSQQGLNGVNIILSDDQGRVGRTDVGGSEALSLFNRVLPAMVSYTRSQEPDFLTFSAAADGKQFRNENLGIDRAGKSRQNLYDRLVRTAASIVPGYIAGYQGESTRTYFISKEEHKEKASKYISESTMLVNTAESDAVVWLDAPQPEWFTEEAWLGDNVIYLGIPEEYVTADQPALEIRNARNLMRTGVWSPPTVLVQNQANADQVFIDRVLSGVVRNACIYEEQPDESRVLIANVTEGKVEMVDQERYQQFLRRADR